LKLPSGYLLEDEDRNLGIQDIIEGDGTGEAAHSAKRARLEQTHLVEHENLGLSEDAALAEALRLSEDSHLDYWLQRQGDTADGTGEAGPVRQSLLNMETSV